MWTLIALHCLIVSLSHCLKTLANKAETGMTSMP